MYIYSYRLLFSYINCLLKLTAEISKKYLPQLKRFCCNKFYCIMQNNKCKEKKRNGLLPNFSIMSLDL